MIEELSREELAACLHKRCSKCGRVAYLGEFSRDPSRRYGVHHTCRKCCSLASRERTGRLERGIGRKPVSEQECTSCGVTKVACDFPDNRTKSTGIGSICKFCCSEKERARRRLPRTKYNVFVSRSKKSGVKCDSTFEEWLSASEKTECESCGRSARKMHIDHCHKTGKIRGTLCGPCNQAEGLAGGIDGLKKLIKYLEQSE